MKVHKLEVIVIDFDEVGADGIRDVIENARYPNRCISPHVRSVETRDIGEWRDDHPLNNRSTQTSEIDRLFAAHVRPTVTVERALDILNENQHHGNGNWHQAREGLFAHGLSHFEGPDELSEFELLAIANAYLAQSAGSDGL